MVGLRVATANIHQSLGRRAAARSLGAVLDQAPDLVALQEWHPGRARLLAARGDYTWFPRLAVGCVVGARRERFVPVGGAVRWLSRPGRAENTRRRGWEPPRSCVVRTFEDHVDGAVVTLISFHLVSGVQAAGDYHPDRPRLVARHRAEVARLEAVVTAELGAGRTTYAAGDSNLHGFALPGLTSAWTGRDDEPGTLGRHRRVDDVFGPSAPDQVLRIPTDSDHQAVLAGWNS